jgi:predicted methyltransferase
MKIKKLMALCIGMIFSLLILGQNQDTFYTHKTPSYGGSGKVFMGREIAAMQGFEGAEWLERSNRQEEENSMEAVKHFPLKPGSIIADLGAGTGYYTFLLAPKVPLGKIYAVEVQDEYIDYLHKKINKTRFKNIEVIKGIETNPNLPKGKLDLVFMVDVYHEMAYPREMLAAIKNSLKPGGLILLLEYKAEDPEVPIKELHKMSLIQVDRELKSQGFIKESIGEFLPWQHFILYKKPNI